MIETTTPAPKPVQTPDDALADVIATCPVDSDAGPAAVPPAGPSAMARVGRWLRGLWREDPRVTEPGARSRTIEVGWLVDTPKSGVVFASPRPINRRLGKPLSPKAVQVCPAVVDFESRYYVVPCPVDLRLRLGRDKDGKYTLINAAGEDSPIYRKKVRELVHLTDPSQWRYRDKPVVQISAPYRFFADEPVWMHQLPPFLHYRDPAWPGTLIAGRLPIHIWPRIMMWAFEWHDPAKELVLRRGEPWFLAHFEATDPTRPFRLVEAAMTPELQAYCASIDGVANYVNRTYGLFETAAARRPAKLVVPLQTGARAVAGADRMVGS